MYSIHSILIVGGGGGVVWTKAAEMSVTLSDISQARFIVKCLKSYVAYCIYYTEVHYTMYSIHSILIVGGGGVVWTKAGHLSVTISGNLSVQQKISARHTT